MANAKRVGAKIRAARLEAGYTQEQLARKVRGASAADIGRAERGEAELSAEQLKQVALATGVTQKSLLEAAKSTRTTAARTAAPGTRCYSAKITATERTMLELFRAADSKTKQDAMRLLRGKGTEALVENVIGNVIGSLTKKK